MEMIIGIIFIIVGIVVEACAVNSMQNSISAIMLTLLGCVMWMGGSLYIAWIYF